MEEKTVKSGDEMIEIDPKFRKFIDVFFCKKSPDELSEGEKHAYILF